VKIGLVVFELKWGENENFAATRLKLDDIRSFGIHLRSETDWNITILISAG